jgi:small conductance mechanosensitive channel
MAWAGLLSNFAAGAFLLVLRPLKVGDFITAGGVTGTVHELGLFVTTLHTPDNVLTFVGSNKIFSDTIQNFTANPFRRVDLTAQCWAMRRARRSILWLCRRRERPWPSRESRSDLG